MINSHEPKLIFFVGLIFLSTLSVCFAQTAELDVVVIIPDRSALSELVAAGLGIDNYIHSTGEVYGVILESNLPALEALGYPMRILPETDARVLASERKEPSGYPTHAAYVNFMVQVANDHPSIASLDTIGWSVNGRPLLMMKISDNVSANECEPEFCYISTMHGDEPVGFVFLMWFIDSLTDRYATNSRIKRLVDSCEIFINPLMNPDGYVSMTRNNANGTDLNRNFPVPDGTIGDDGIYTTRTETNAIINWAQQHYASYTINFHGGALVVNYPWDYDSTKAPDDSLFKFISINYSRRNPPMYASSTFPYGITNGYDWYEANGTLQDWTYWACGDLHLTVELENTKTPTFDTLPSLWANNYDAFLAAIEVTLNHGVTGIVTDSLTGAPLGATITFTVPNKTVRADPSNGCYHRILLPGNYSATFSHTGYQSKTITITVPDSGLTHRDVQLVPITSPPEVTVLLYPFNNARFGSGSTSTTPTLSWSVPGDPDGGNLHFAVQWDDDPNFGSPTTIESRTNTTGFSPTPPRPQGTGTCSYTIGSQGEGTLSNGQTYWWRVRAHDGLNYGSWSTPRSLTVNTSLSHIDWFQTTDAQFASDVLSNVAPNGSGGVILSNASTNLLVSTSCSDAAYNSGQSYEWYSKWTPPGSGTVTVTKLWFWDGNGSISSSETIYMAMYYDGII